MHPAAFHTQRQAALQVPPGLCRWGHCPARSVRKRRPALHADFHVQVGGMALHDGQVAEMATGEGKTLVATLPAYLNALTGLSVHIVTVNDYLAVRDADW